MAASDAQPYVVLINDTREILALFFRDPLEEGYRVATFAETLDLERLKGPPSSVIVQSLLFADMQEKGWTFPTMARLDSDLARVPLALCTAAAQIVSSKTC